LVGFNKTVVNVLPPYLYILKLDSSLGIDPALATIVYRCNDVHIV